MWIALITGHDPETVNKPSRNSYGAGDFAIDFGKNGSYELGVNIITGGFGVAGGVYSNPVWAYGLWDANGKEAAKSGEIRITSYNVCYTKLLRAKAASYRMATASVDGMDALAVYKATREAADKVRAEGEPFFLELRTYRFRAHSMFDPDLYRDKDEVEAWKQHDPIVITSYSIHYTKLYDRDPG